VLLSTPLDPNDLCSLARSRVRQPPGMLLAATDPERVQSVCGGDPPPAVFGAPTTHGECDQTVEREERQLQHWGTFEDARIWAEGEALYGGRTFSQEEIRAFAKLSRRAATPDVARDLAGIWFETDIRSVLPSVNVATLLLDQQTTPSDVEETQYIGSLMPLAEFKPLSPAVSMSEVVAAVVDETRRFAGIEPRKAELEHGASHLPVHCIVDSTRRQSARGAHAWKDSIQRHHAAVRDSLRRWSGVEMDTAGDGLFATYDGPARAIRCALDIVHQVRELGIEIRAGVHTGECEIADGKCTGIAVTIGTRLAADGRAIRGPRITDG
jgi:hypothetical protein